MKKESFCSSKVIVKAGFLPLRISPPAACMLLPLFIRIKAQNCSNLGPVSLCNSNGDTHCFYKNTELFLSLNILKFFWF